MILNITGGSVVVDDDILSGLIKYSWHVDRVGYAACSVYDPSKKRVVGTRYMHRYVLALKEIDVPKGLEVDHINHNKLDNRFDNLRIVTHSDNQSNQTRVSKMGRGIRKVLRDKKYYGEITKDWIVYRTDRVNTIEEAKELYDKLRKQLYR
jgi:hypothetical protein